MADNPRSNAYNTYSTLPPASCCAQPASVVLYQHAYEASPLLPMGMRHEELSISRFLRAIGWCLALVFLLFMGNQTLTHLTRCPPDPSVRDAIRREWEKEKAKHDLQREEEERQRRHMFWGQVEAHTCTTYATRDYTAELMNLPISWKHPLDACRDTPLEIHGILHLPTTCEERGPGVVIGRWKINQLEPECTTYWDSYNDRGCTSPGSGRKYVTHKLENLPEKADWREFCATTPAHFDHLQFPGAQECIHSIWGVYGQWEIYDYDC